MRYLVPILIAALAVPGWQMHGAAPLPGLAAAQDFNPLPFHELAERVAQRYRGRLVGAGIARPTPPERDLGAALVYEFRVVTPQRNLLRIRLDARDGRFLEVAGRGQLQALRGGAQAGDRRKIGHEDGDDD